MNDLCDIAQVFVTDCSGDPDCSCSVAPVSECLFRCRQSPNLRTNAEIRAIDDEQVYTAKSCRDEAEPMYNELAEPTIPGAVNFEKGMMYNSLYRAIMPVVKPPPIIRNYIIRFNAKIKKLNGAAEVAARRAHNPEDLGSKPSLAIFLFLPMQQDW
ncbi:hypothetical protein KCU65_g81, partial [Aureobasidium melanogenum]